MTHPLASAGTVVFILWVISGLLVGAGRETAARWALTGSIVATIVSAAYAGPLEIRRPALFLLAAMLLLNLLALGVRPVIRTAASARTCLVGGTFVVAAALALCCRVAVAWHPANTAYVGNALVLAGISRIVLIAFGVAAAISLGSRTGRRDVLPALLICVGPWALLVARASSNQATSSHQHSAIVVAAWVIGIALFLAWRMTARGRVSSQ
ncbi:hypothetical protein [uncultured Jatrophihabitans sp.]|uniref:hypothetical protein n=1 Tax=uncultured Jatrophihabitans sp. TaxID=1610747 RepID=UPI0035CA0E61